jgi:hypothetical protein
MKHLLNGVAIAAAAAALAIAAPVWAQGTMTPGAPATPAPAAAAAAPAAAPAHKAMAKQMHHPRPMRHMAMSHHGTMKMMAGDQMTEQLNHEELARIQSGQGGTMAPAPMMAPPPPPAGH